MATRPKQLSFRDRPELKETRDEVLYIGLKFPSRLTNQIAQLDKQSHDIIYEHAVLGRQLAYIGRDWNYCQTAIARKWIKAIEKYHKRFKEVEGCPTNATH